MGRLVARERLTISSAGLSAERPAISEVRARTSTRSQDLALGHGMPFGRVENDGLRNSEVHCHEFMEVSLICSGAANHVTAMGRQELGPGSVLIVHPEQTHMIENPSNLVHLNIYYLPDWLADDVESLWRERRFVRMFLVNSVVNRLHVPEIPAFPVSAADLTSSLTDMREMNEELLRATPSLTFVRSCLLKCLLRLARAYGEGPHGPGTENFREEVWLTLDQVERSATEGHSLDVARMAASMNITPDHLTRLFHDAVGESPVEYYQRRRAHHAARLLLMPGIHITDIAHRLGYSDSSHMSRVFRRYLGVCPREYRRRHFASSSDSGSSPGSIFGTVEDASR